MVSMMPTTSAQGKKISARGARANGAEQEIAVCPKILAMAESADRQAIE